MWWVRAMSSSSVTTHLWETNFVWNKLCTEYNMIIIYRLLYTLCLIFIIIINIDDNVQCTMYNEGYNSWSYLVHLAYSDTVIILYNTVITVCRQFVCNLSRAHILLLTVIFSHYITKCITEKFKFCITLLEIPIFVIWSHLSIRINKTRSPTRKQLSFVLV